MTKAHNEQPKSDTQRIEIERDQAEALMRSERWQTTADTADPLAALCPRPVLESKSVNIYRLTEITPDDLIDRFLRATNLRIVARQDDAEEQIVTEAALDEEEDLVSEELAEIYLAQGLKDMAKETYRKLSLRNPEKSVYFAGLIAKIDNN